MSRENQFCCSEMDFFFFFLSGTSCCDRFAFLGKISRLQQEFSSYLGKSPVVIFIRVPNTKWFLRSLGAERDAMNTRRHFFSPFICRQDERAVSSCRAFVSDHVTVIGALGMSSSGICSLQTYGCFAASSRSFLFIYFFSQVFRRELSPKVMGSEK